MKKHIVEKLSKSENYSVLNEKLLISVGADAKVKNKNYKALKESRIEKGGSHDMSVL